MTHRIQQVYDNLSDIFAVISAFTNVKEFSLGGEFGDDIRSASNRITLQSLISLCALTRNFIEGTNSISQSKSISIRLVFINYEIAHSEPEYSNASINLYQAMSRIIHSVNLEIVNDTISQRPLPGDVVDAYTYIRSKKAIDPVVYCKTESDGLCIFKINDLLSSIHSCVDKILERDDIPNLLPRNIRDV